MLELIEDRPSTAIAPASAYHAGGDGLVVRLATGWQLAIVPPGSALHPRDLPGELCWRDAHVPGTAAQSVPDAAMLDACDVWYRLRPGLAGPHILHFAGLATLAEVWLDDAPLLASDSMFVATEARAMLRGQELLTIRFRALGQVRPAHPAPRAARPRWRTRLIDTPALRQVRGTALGRMPGWCPPIHPVGPWREVLAIAETGPVVPRHVDLRTAVSGRDGVLAVEIVLRGNEAAGQPAWVQLGDRRAPLAWAGPDTLRGSVVLPDVALWWPHTHGHPALHEVRAGIGTAALDLGRVGFRTLAVDRGADGNGFALSVNGVPVFCRGACWTSADIVSLAGTPDAYLPWLRMAREAGMNMVRIGGTMAYETPAFHTLCDELGLLVWQDLMFANFDYPAGDPAFDALVTAEATQLLRSLQGRASLAVLCGGSEIQQQAAMMGVAADGLRHPVFDRLLPDLAASLRPDVPYVPGSPSGGDLPFRVDTGISHYYGVGAYRRPLDDARRAGVRFAAECLALANVPAFATRQDRLRVPAVHHPAWKEGVPRDPGAAWDFEDIRDHYLAELYGVQPAALRMEDPERYLALSQAVSAELMQAVFSEWRRPGSSCAGGLVWQLQDLRPGAGWGVIDVLGRPKAAWHGLAGVLQPVQLLLADEGLNGLMLHLLNETLTPVAARLDLACLDGGEVAVAEAGRDVVIPARGTLSLSATTLLGRFFDITRAYRFGPASHDVTVASLRHAETGTLLSEAAHFPQGRARPPESLGLAARVEQDAEGPILVLHAARLAQSVHLESTGCRGATEWFHLPPRQERRIRLLPFPGRPLVPQGEVHALNQRRPVRFGAQT